MYRGTVPGRGGGGEYRRGDTKEEDRGRRDGDTYAVERREERGDSERLLSLRQTVLLVGHSPIDLVPNLYQICSSCNVDCSPIRMHDAGSISPAVYSFDVQLSTETGLCVPRLL